MSKKLPIILDVDTGIDDAVAVMLATMCPKIDVKLITTCHGNTTIENITNNTLSMLYTLGIKNVPVAVGMDHAIKKIRPHVSVHGSNGLGGYYIKNNPLKPLEKSALEATHEVLQKAYEPITMVCISPPTNIANLLINHPEDANKIKQIVLMVGSNEIVPEGSIPYKEFNASVDPEALTIVLDSKVPKVIISMEMGHTAYLNWEDVYKTKKANDFGALLETIYRDYHDYHIKNGIATHDGCAVAYLIEPQLFTLKPGNMTVEFFEELGSGVGVIDYDKKPNVQITQTIDVKRFKKLYFKYLKKCKMHTVAE